MLKEYTKLGEKQQCSNAYLQTFTIWPFCTGNQLKLVSTTCIAPPTCVDT